MVLILPRLLLHIFLREIKSPQDRHYCFQHFNLRQVSPGTHVVTSAERNKISLAELESLNIIDQPTPRIKGFDIVTKDFGITVDGPEGNRKSGL